MSVSLTPVSEDLVRVKVANGYYNSASEFIREALRLMDTNEKLFAQAKVNLLQKHIVEGMEDVHTGKSTNLTTTTEVGQFFDGIKTLKQKDTP